MKVSATHYLLIRLQRGYLKRRRCSVVVREAFPQLSFMTFPAQDSDLSTPLSMLVSPSEFRDVKSAARKAVNGISILRTDGSRSDPRARVGTPAAMAALRPAESSATRVPRHLRP